MDGQQFDKLARGLAFGTSRRSVLGLIGAGVAAIGAHLTIPKAAAGCTEPGGACDPQLDSCCAGSICNGRICVLDCVDLFGQCNDDNLLCCPGLECVEGICLIQCGGVGDPCFIPSDVHVAGGGFECCNEGLECLDGTCQAPEPECGAEGDYCGPKSNECCNEGLECIEDYCEVPEPQCIETGESCDLDLAGVSECCDKGAECLDGICQIPEPVCAGDGESCGSDDDCCEGLDCIEGVCSTTPEPVCIEEGEACEADGDCCEGICCGGFCRNIECCIDDENPNDRCDDGQSCFEGICEGVSDICEGDADCADDTCCCDDGSCSADCCEVTQLPSTGSGSGTASKAGWFGAAALGAAAAFLGSKKLQPEEQPTRNDEA